MVIWWLWCLKSMKNRHYSYETGRFEKEKLHYCGLHETYSYRAVEELIKTIIPSVWKDKKSKSREKVILH